MKKIILAAAAVSLLAGCGGSIDARQVLLDSCVADGEVDAKGCACMVDAMDSNLDDAQMTTLAETIQAGGDDEEAMGKMMENLGEEKAMALGMSMMPCVMGMPE